MLVYSNYRIQQKHIPPLFNKALKNLAIIHIHLRSSRKILKEE